MRGIVTAMAVAGLVLVAATPLRAQTAPPAPPTGAEPAPAPAPAPAPVPLPPAVGPRSTMGQGAPFSMPSGDDPSGMAGRSDEAFVNCEGCVAVAAPLKKKGEAALKILQDTGALPQSLARLSSADIETLLRGKSWSSDVLAGPFGKEYQRLLAFDPDGRGRWLNFRGGPKGYSTLCQFQVDEDLLCFSCAPGPAECSALYRDGDLVVAFDQERGQFEVLDWITKSRWENDRFLAPH